MAHGSPDWDVTAGGRTTYQLHDLAELAVRLGSIVSFDRLGEAFYLDDFEITTPRYSFDTVGTGAAVAYSTAAARNGARSLLLTAGSDAGRRASSTFACADLTPSHVGHQISFLIDANVEAFEVAILQRDGAASWDTLLRWDALTTQLLVMNELGAMVAIADDVRLDVSGNVWNTIKLVVDLEDHHYARVKLNDRLIDVHNFGIATGPDASAPQISYSWNAKGAAGTNALCYTDDLVLTQNEPAGSPATA